MVVDAVIKLLSPATNIFDGKITKMVNLVFWDLLLKSLFVKPENINLLIDDLCQTGIFASLWRSASSHNSKASAGDLPCFFRAL